MFDLKKALGTLVEGKALFLEETEAVILARPPVDTDVMDMEKGRIRAFAFETLMNNEVRSAVLKGDVETEFDVIPNYKEINVESEEGSDYHTIVPELGNFVRGMIMYVDQAQLDKLDYWEDQYDRVKCLLQSGRSAFVYVLRTENMKDVGKNTSVELSPDDVAQIAWAADNM